MSCSIRIEKPVHAMKRSSADSSAVLLAPRNPSRKNRILSIIVLLCCAVASLAFFLRPQSPPSIKGTVANHPVVARQLGYAVLKSYPHDPRAFTQGLVWEDNGFYESTGLEGRSSLRRVEFPSGKVLKLHNLSPELFGEGLAEAGNRLFQITWRSGRAFVYDKDTFNLLNEFSYEGEGWGITYDGTQLIMSDGSDTLFYRDPTTFEVRRRVPVTMNGKPLRDLNELEWIDGRVWANVWQTDIIVIIDPATGIVTDFLNLANLLPASQRTGQEDVLNGIAYDAKTRHVFVGGKLWPRLFELRVDAPNQL